MNRLLLLINRLARRDRRSQKPKSHFKIIDGLLALVGVLFSLALVGVILIVLLMVIFPKNFPIPDDASWLYQYQEPQTKVTGDQRIGGGYAFMFDGRDLWLRFRVKEDSVPTTPQYSMACKPDEFAEIKQWFLENVRDRFDFSSALNLWANPSGIDLQSLNDLSNLRCFKSGVINNKLGQEPTNSGLWMLYNSKTKLLYLRYADYG